MVIFLCGQAAERATDVKSIRGYPPPDMRYRSFGKTGEKVSVLGFGTMRLRGHQTSDH